MPAHIHPSLPRFTCEYRPIFNGVVHPGSVSRTTQGPPRAQSPFARLRRYHQSAQCIWHCVRGRYPSFIARTDSCVRPKPSRLIRFLIRRVFAGCRQSLLGDGPSRRYLCNPCMGAWTPTPGCLSGALVRFFPESYSLTAVLPSSAHPTYHRNATSTMPGFSGRQSFRYVQAPMLARPPDGTYRTGSKPRGQPGRLRHAMNGKLPSRTVVSLHDRIGQLSWRDFHPLDCSLVGCSLEPFRVLHQRWRV